ncbi:hypothetical protein KSF_028140 [Reticulibacter mediterranei]|uniref:DUF4291 domain-containing protein n=1 Tax=Reticulibacter mediterranei TaxID=2778369 RepID=A0A8J3INW5_9CHLR|nr:DUF4291 domain-containing protein [Reticulibacter mediterranei]GHO92766.1 hypothetical protein KSF_028140 [Reticulibacter mediterranei]
MRLITETYLAQAARWPATGRHILAQYDDNSIIVYQAYRPAIGHFAACNGYFGGEFSFSRMSWIKPNFLWMQYRSGWGGKPGQEVTLAIRLQRAAFDRILAGAIHSTYKEAIYGSEATWKQRVAQSDVRLQWDPDHHPSGARLERRAIQLSLRGETLARYAREWILEIEDITDFVREQYEAVRAEAYERLITPQERVYPQPAHTGHVQIASEE